MPGLQKVAAVLVVPGKGILAADASIATMSSQASAAGSPDCAQPLSNERQAGCA